MARKLKTYQTSMGFFDLAIAAASMKAALEAWGSKSNLFHQGFAKEIDDPAVVSATMSKPGVVLKRPVGSNGSFKEDAKLPGHLSGEGRPRKQRPKQTAHKGRSLTSGKKSARRASLEYEREQRRRESERRKEEAERDRREQVIARAKAAIEEAKRDHEKIVREIEGQRPHWTSAFN
jgi:colicin import membrane protein